MNALQGITSRNLRYSVKQTLSQASKEHQHNVRPITTSKGKIDQEYNSRPHKIVVPKRVERGPTDILKALSGTVKRDYTAPHFKYHDDPFCIPTSNIAKRMFALSQESGRKAAQWVRQEHADLFQHRVADPPIEAFFPRAVYDQNSEVDESVLEKLIAQHLLSDALTVYGLLEEKGVELSRSSKQNLLELVCYYNSENPLEEDWIEERWFKQGTKSKEKKINTWKRGQAAERLFSSLKPPDSASYSAMICGMAHFGDVVGAHKLYQEALDAGMSLPTEVYNRLIVGASTLKELHELRWKFLEEMLNTMSNQGVTPDLGTLNAVLECIASMSSNRNSQKNALSALAEFRAMGIEPSLASYYFLLTIFCRGKTVKSAILINIMNMLEGKSLSIRDPRDVLFFNEAMENCRFHLADVGLAYRIDKLLHTANNYNLIGDSFKESIYYRNFFGLVLQMSTLDEFMDLYNKLVPHVYVPEAGVMEDIIKTVSMNDAGELLPRLWVDMVMFDYGEKESMLCTMLSSLQKSTSTDSKLLQQHADVAWAIWERIENQREDRKNKRIQWTGQMLGEILEVLLRADKYLQAMDIINCLDQRQQEVLGVPSIESLSSFLEKSIERKAVKNAIWCIQYCSDAGFEDTIKLAQRLISSMQLKDDEVTLLTRIVGQDNLQKQITSIN